MCKKVSKVLSLLLVFAIAFSGFNAVALTAKTKYSVTTLKTESITNPLYKEVDTENSSAVTVIPKKYYSNPSDPFDVGLCTTDINDIVATLRETMVNREPSVDLYYQNTTLYTEQPELEAFLNDLLERTLAETETPNEGDYLAYVYKRYEGNLQTQYTPSEGVYYHKITVSLEYYTTKDQENQVDTKIDSVIDEFNFTSQTTEKQKSDAIYEYITENVTYDYENLNTESYTLKFSTYAALINGTAVCQGYATLFYRLARECGLETRVVTGISNDPTTSESQNHAWNIVKLGDYYYLVDATWDAGKNPLTYEFYLKNESDFYNHFAEDKFNSSDFLQKHPITAESWVDELEQGKVSGDYTYDVLGGKAYITKYTGNAKHLVVPSTLGGYPVAQFGPIQYDGSHVIEYNDTLQSITFSEGIKGMGMESLFSCYALKTINFPSTMAIDYEKYVESGLAVYAGYSALPNFCDAVETVTVAAGNKKMKVVDGIIYSADGKEAIYCPAKYKKSEITLPDGIVTIIPSAFNDCENIKKVTMPDTVKYIGYWAFDGTSLEQVNIPDGCKIIGQFAFQSTNLTSIHIPASVNNLMGGAFGADTKLQHITVDENSEYYYVKDGALIYKNPNFTNCEWLLDYELSNPATTYTVPDSVIWIDQYAFADSKLKKIDIPDSVTQINAFAFERCNSLTHIEFPANLEKLWYGTLSYCENIASVIIPSTITNIDDSSLVGIENEEYTVYGETGSAAHTFAQNNGIKFKTISDFRCQSGHVMKMKEYNGGASYQYVCANCGDASSMHYRLNIVDTAYNGARLNKDTFKYTGNAIKPTIASFMDGEKKMVQNVDYKIIGYVKNINVGWGALRIQGIGKYYGTADIQFQITPATSNVTAKLSYSSTTYTGKTKKPAVTAKFGSKKLTSKDYKVKYATSCKSSGKHKVVITLKNNFSGKKTLYFTINPAKPKVKKVSGAKKALNVTLSKKTSSEATGFQIQYSTNKKFKSAKTKTASYKTTSVKLSKLSAKKKYYVRVRTYKTSSGKKYYSGWSSVKYAKTK